VPRSLPCGSGDTRRAALCPPVRPQCWFFPLAQACPTVMPEQSPHHEDAFGAPCVVRIDTHGSKDRAKDASTEESQAVNFFWPASVACASCACATTFPSSASSGHPLSSARRSFREDTRYARRTDRGPRSDDAPRRAPPSRRPGCLRPPRHVREWYAKGLLPPALTPALSLTPPTLAPWREKCF